MPPDLAHTTDPKKVMEALGDLERQIGTKPLDRDAAWRLFATLNPLLGDGHLFVGFVDWRADARTHLASGGVFLPFEVTASRRGRTGIAQALGGAASDLAGARIESINGVDARAVTAALLARVHGDTPDFRAALLSRRFWLYYWKVFGAPARFRFRIRRNDRWHGTSMAAQRSPRYWPTKTASNASSASSSSQTARPCSR